MTTDPHDVLGIPRDATLAEARSAYRRLAELFHPDRLEGHREEVKVEANRRMEELNAAWSAIQQGAASQGRPDLAEAARAPATRDEPEEVTVIGNAEVRHVGPNPRLHMRWAGDGAQAAAMALRRLSQGGVAAREVDWGAFTATLEGVDTRRLLEEVVVARHPQTIVEVLIPEGGGTIQLAEAVTRLQPTERYDLYAETFA